MLTATETTAIWTPTTLASNTEYNVTVKAYDNAGNPSKESMATPVKTKEAPIIPTTENDMGKYVNYKPVSGTYSKEILDKYSGCNENEAFTTDNNLKWRIWSSDENKLVLVADRTITQGGYPLNGKSEGVLRVCSALGYNNVVDILDGICENCYSNRNLWAVARSLDLEDILAVPGVTYSYSKENGFTTSEYNFYAPSVWLNYEVGSGERSVQNRSVRYGLTTDTGTKVSGQTLFWTHWGGKNDYGYYLTNWPKQLELITSAITNKDRDNASAWVMLATRMQGISLGAGSYFGVVEVTEYRGLYYGWIFNGLIGTGEGGSVTRSILPVVEIDMSKVNIIKSTSSEFSYEIQPK